jgi:hypothetical protein
MFSALLLMLVINIIMQLTIYFTSSNYGNYLLGSFVGVILCLIGLVWYVGAIFDIVTFFFLLFSIINLDK